jgi:cytochrome P450
METEWRAQRRVARPAFHGPHLAAMASAMAEAHAESVAAAMVSTFDYFDHAFNHLFTAPLFIPTARNRAFKRAIEAIHALVAQRIEEARKNPSATQNDLLAMILEADRNEPDSAGLVDNLSTFLGAGTEPTAVALCWAWYPAGKTPCRAT